MEQEDTEVAEGAASPAGFLCDLCALLCKSRAGPRRGARTADLYTTFVMEVVAKNKRCFWPGGR